MKKNTQKISAAGIIFILVFLLGTIIRLHPILTNTFAFTYDVGRDMLALAQIVYAHKIPLIGPTTGLPGLFYGPWWYYVLTPAFAISGGNPQGVASFMVLVGLATIFCGYVLGKYMGSGLLGAFIAGLLAFSSATVSLSIQIWNPNIAQLFILLVAFLLVRLKKNGLSMPMYVVLGLLLGLTIDSEVVFGLLFTIGVIAAMLLLLRKKIKKTGIGLMVLGLFVIFSPRIFFEIRHHFVMTTHIIQLLNSSPDTSGSLSFAAILMQRISMFWDTWNWSFAKILPLSVLALLATIWQLWVFVKNGDHTLPAFLAKMIAVVSGVFFVGLLFFRHDIFSHYLVALPVYFLLWSGVSMYVLVNRYFKEFAVVAVVSLFLLILMRPVGVYNDYFGPQWQGDPSVLRNQMQVVDYIYAQAGGKPFKYVTYTPAVIDYPYQYLFAWYGPKKYKYTSSTQAPLMFYILEPNTAHPDLRNVWLEQRSNDGKVTKTQILQGDITVQTRVQ